MKPLALAPPRPRPAGVAARTRVNLGTTFELVTLLWQSGRFWLLPMLVVLGVSLLLLLVVQAIEYVAPFVYTIF